MTSIGGRLAHGHGRRPGHDVLRRQQDAGRSERRIDQGRAAPPPAATAGPHLAELIKAGQPVAVTYTGRARRRSTRPAIKSGPAGRVFAASAAEATAAVGAGVVKSMGADWITISGKRRRRLNLRADLQDRRQPRRCSRKGAGTATAAKGGSMPFADLRDQRRSRQRLVSNAGQLAARVGCPRDDEGDPLAPRARCRDGQEGQERQDREAARRGGHADSHRVSRLSCPFRLYPRSVFRIAPPIVPSVSIRSVETSPAFPSHRR